jgi:hypothetical protein
MTTIYHINGRAVIANLTSDSLHVSVTVYETIEPMKKTVIQFIAQDTGNGILVMEQKEIASNEFRWSLDKCRLNTEIGGSALCVEWRTQTPTQHDHENQKFEIEWPVGETVHIVSMMLERNAEVISSWNGYTLQGDGQMGRVNIVNVIYSEEEPSPPSPP